MPEISQIKLPSGNIYTLKDTVAREMAAGGMSFIIAWNGTSTPVVANIPAGVVVTYNGTSYTGTLAVTAAQGNAFYLIKSATAVESTDVYDEYTVIKPDTSDSTTWFWEKIGDTQLDLSDLGALAYKDNVNLSKGSGDQVLGEDTTFTAESSAVSFSGGTTDEFVKEYSGTKQKLNTTTVPNVTSVGAASTWSFAMGTGADAETLIISGANGSAPTLGTAKTVATGSLASNGSGDEVMTGLGTATKAAAVTNIGTATAAAQNIAVGTNDKVKVAKYDDLGVSAS